MKLQHATRRAVWGFFLLLWGVSLAAAATETNKPAGPATNAPAAINPNEYKSIFENKGRDPFFPTSSRSAIQVSADGGDQPAVVLVLKGISGSASHRLAIINDHTFASGDENEVLTAAGRIRVRCLEIRDDTAVVTILGTPGKIDLKLPARF
jgi:hypothetical protein